MTNFETYLLLFTDVLVSNFAFNISPDIVFGAMKIFEYDKKLMILVASMAYATSIIINYLLGIVCYKILAPVNSNETDLNSKIKYINNFKFLPLIIALSCIPFFGKFIILLGGFAKVNFKLIFFIALIAKVVYYSLLVVSSY
jgi:membrane protein YqaA with SNARE-associated domain